MTWIAPSEKDAANDALEKRLWAAADQLATLDYDAFGRIYEYFLGEFARTEGQKGGEFYTPSPIVRLLVEVLEPYHGRVLDPACGSGGMFVQSARFIHEHQRDPSRELSIHGQEKEGETVNLCRMNLAVHGLDGEVKQGITYYDDLHHSTGRFNFVLANPPFNVNAVDKERGPDDPVCEGVSEGPPGRAGFVMPSQAPDARASKQEIRRQPSRLAASMSWSPSGQTCSTPSPSPCTPARGRPAEDLPNLHQHPPQRAAQKGLRNRRVQGAPCPSIPRHPDDAKTDRPNTGCVQRAPNPAMRGSQ